MIEEERQEKMMIIRKSYHGGMRCPLCHSPGFSYLGTTKSLVDSRNAGDQFYFVSFYLFDQITVEAICCSDCGLILHIKTPEKK